MPRLALLALALHALALLVLPLPAQEPAAQAPQVSQAPQAPQQEGPAKKVPSTEELEKAQTLLAREDWDAAVQHLAPLHERFPEHGRTLMLYGFALHGAGKLEQALAIHQRVAALDDEALAGIGLYNSACAYALLGKKEAAIYALFQAAKAGFDDAAHLKGDRDLDALRDDIRFQKLVFALEDGEPVPVVQFRPSIRDVQLLVRAKRFDDAAKAVDVVLERQPGLPFGIYYKGYVLHMQGKLQEALAWHEKASELRAPLGSSASYNAACVHAQLGHTDQAFAWLDKAIEKGFRDAKTLAADTDLEKLHDDPRWAKLLERLRDD